MAKKRLNRDQKRKAKLTERSRKEPAKSVMAYAGNKFKNAALTPIFQSTETGIYQAYRITDRDLTDHSVRLALEELVVQMRAGTLPPYEHTCEMAYHEGEEEELVISAIRHNWHHFFTGFPHPGTESLIGVLRTLLDSVETWSTPGPSSRGYLNYLEGFMAKLGVRVEVEGEEEEDEDELFELGRVWLEEGEQPAGKQFFELAEEQIEAGEGQEVANVAQRLIGLTAGGDHLEELSQLAIRAQRAPRKSPGTSEP